MTTFPQRAALALLMLLSLAFSVGVHAAATPAGQVVLVTGDAQASNPDTLVLRTLQKDDPVYAGEIISAGPNTYVNLKFTDGSFALLRPNSRFEIEAYAAPASPPSPVPVSTASPEPVAAATPAPDLLTPEATEPERGRAFFRLLKGGFRAVSGLIGRSDPAEYRVSTPVATIGIRGTDYWAVLCDATCATDPALGAQLPPGVSAEGGILVGVMEGRVVVVNAAGDEVEIGAGEMLLTLADGTQIRLQQAPDFLQLNPLPDPTELCDDD